MPTRATNVQSSELGGDFDSWGHHVQSERARPGQQLLGEESAQSEQAPWNGGLLVIAIIPPMEG